MEISRIREMSIWPPASRVARRRSLFTLAWAVLGALSPGYRLFDLVIDPYSPIAQPISGLGLGVTGPYMNAAFIVGGRAGRGGRHRIPRPPVAVAARDRRASC